MYRTILADRLVIAKFTFFQSVSGIFKELKTIRTQGGTCMMQFGAIHTNHGTDDQEFPFAARLEDDTH